MWQTLLKLRARRILNSGLLVDPPSEYSTGLGSDSRRVPYAGRHTARAVAERAVQR